MNNLLFETEQWEVRSEVLRSLEPLRSFSISRQTSRTIAATKRAHTQYHGEIVSQYVIEHP